jgi:hypothetical protein
LDHAPLPAIPLAPAPLRHANIRGPEYYSFSQGETHVDSSHTGQTASSETDGDV